MLFSPRNIPWYHFFLGSLDPPLFVLKAISLSAQEINYKRGVVNFRRNGRVYGETGLRLRLSLCYVLPRTNNRSKHCRERGGKLGGAGPGRMEPASKNVAHASDSWRIFLNLLDSSFTSPVFLFVAHHPNLVI